MTQRNSIWKERTTEGAIENTHILFFPSKYKEHRGKEHLEITIENTFQKVDEKQEKKKKTRELM